MATETDTKMDALTTNGTPSGKIVGIGGAVAGLVAGIAMGGVFATVVPSFITSMTPSLYDLQGAIAGWFAHGVHSVVFGVVFALLATKSPLNRYVTGVGRTTVFGIGYGIALWIVVTGIIMPIWLALTYYPEAPLVPYLRPWVFVAHAVYGGVLGVLLQSVLAVGNRVL